MLLSQSVLLLSARNIIPTASVIKRWYSIQPIAYQKAKGNYGPWPVVHAGNSVEQQPVRYCFPDPRSRKNLEHVLDQAIAEWNPIFLHSLLRTPLLGYCDGFDLDATGPVARLDVQGQHRALDWRMPMYSEQQSSNGLCHVQRRQRSRRTQGYNPVDSVSVALWQRRSRHQ